MCVQLTLKPTCADPQTDTNLHFTRLRFARFIDEMRLCVKETYFAQ